MGSGSARLVLARRNPLLPGWPIGGFSLRTVPDMVREALEVELPSEFISSSALRSSHVSARENATASAVTIRAASSVPVNARSSSAR